MSHYMFISFLLLAVLSYDQSYAFTSFSSSSMPNAFTATSKNVLQMVLKEENISINSDQNEEQSAGLSRRSVLFRSVTSTAAILLSSAQNGHVAFADTTTEKQSLESLLYLILRVREATAQEARLIKTGKFKDAQRANVKLAVKFMIENYRLNDAFVKASAYLETNDKRVQAGQTGQTVVQSLYTILEYFDAADVQNIKVDNLSGKEQLVLKGLDSARSGIDEYIKYFPESVVSSVQAKIDEENALNVKEFDPELGQLLNMPAVP